MGACAHEHAENASQAKEMLTAALATVLRNHAGLYCFWVRTLQTSAVMKGRLWLTVCCARKTFSLTPRKIKTLFKKELEEAAVTGELDNRVEAVFVSLARAWDGDSQSTEGLVSWVRQGTQKPPNLGLGTLNADNGDFEHDAAGYERRTTRLECSEVKTSSRVPHGRARV